MPALLPAGLLHSAPLCTCDRRSASSAQPGLHPPLLLPRRLSPGRRLLLLPTTCQPTRSCPSTLNCLQRRTSCCCSGARMSWRRSAPPNGWCTCSTVSGFGAARPPACAGRSKKTALLRACSASFTPAGLTGVVEQPRPPWILPSTAPPSRPPTHAETCPLPPRSWGPCHATPSPTPYWPLHGPAPCPRSVGPHAHHDLAGHHHRVCHPELD